ncbi:FecR family protein [Pseudomonas sp.]|uniref:FecR family protein n=1 Tax=Pseudomonas sp. TaxID=306 RepID=UPI0028B0508C|nr:FecR domain-containing protein [Pseudomonas sp.]
MSRPPSITEAQLQAALHWLSRINEQPAQAEGAAFKRWLLADPGHRDAYAQAQSLWRSSAAPALRLAEEEGDSLQRYLDAMRRPVKRPWRQRAAALAMAACLVLAVGIAGGWHPGHWLLDAQADYSSAQTIRQISLADRSQVTLDAGSAITVEFAQGERRVRLLHGAAFFQITHNGSPFRVEAGGGEVRVMGTRFEVRALDDGAQVTVSSGRVAVSPAPGGSAQELTADQQLSYRKGQLDTVQRVDSDNRLAWRQGWLNYYQAPLGQVVEDLARYYPGRILLLDDTLAQRTVSGSFPVAEPMQALDSLGQVLGFSRQTLLGRLTLIR